jgi:hypothetical protein
MKKITKILVLLVVLIYLGLVGCEQYKFNKEISNSNEDSEGLYKKEILVTDGTGENKAFYAIYSDDSTCLTNFLESYNFTLKVNENIPNDYLNKQDKIAKQDDFKKYKLQETPKITIELVFANIKNGIKNYSLQITKKISNKKEFLIDGYHALAYTTTKNFIGIILNKKGYSVAVRFRYKLHRFSRWKDLADRYGDNTVIINTEGDYFACIDERYSFYKRGFIVYPDIRQGGIINYSIVYNHKDYRGRVCRIGKYDYNNFGECFVGSSPVGTKAFIWHSKFYYTPVNGNHCPRPGSHFDGANCFVMNIPKGCEAYTWKRNWLVKSENIDDQF